VREPRSIIFYAWAWLLVQSLLTAGVIVFVLTGAASQRSAVQRLRDRVEVAQDAHLAMVLNFLDTQRAARSYQATGDIAALSNYQAGKRRFGTSLAQIQRLTWDGIAGQVAGEARTARAAFAADRQAAALPRNSPAAGRLYNRAADQTARFTMLAGRVRERLNSVSNELAAQGERTLGAGLGWTAAVLTIGLMLPVAAVAVGLRWVSGPLHGATTMVRKRARGDLAVRASPGGPADVRDLCLALNYLADENNRIRDAERDRDLLQAEVRQTSIRIREHLRGEAIISEAVTALHEHFAVDLAWAGIVSGGRLRLSDGQPGGTGRAGAVAGAFNPSSVNWIRDIYRHRSSYRIQDLHSAQAEEIPAEIKKVLLTEGARSLLLTPFGAGKELLGWVILLRSGLGHVWTQPEIDAVESLAGDLGQALEHARLYEDGERLVGELKALDQAKASFLASASHDLRTPLTSIIGYVELLTDQAAGPITPPQAKMLEGVRRNARRLKTMIEDMLTISKIEMGAYTSKLRPVDLTALVPPAAEVIKPSAEAGGLDFEADCRSGPVMVDGDPDQLDRAMVNLLSNAVKYTPKGGTVGLTVGTEDGSAVLTVADTGIGIPEQDQGSLFGRFFRASNAVAAAIPGSGLGLSIVRTIVKNHHGDLDIQSRQDEGTKVTIRIPLLGKPAGAAPEAGDSIPAPQAGSSGAAPQAGSQLDE
jgi:signal transduction histidine kinase/CHASE3 domain sensor protein